MEIRQFKSGDNLVWERSFTAKTTFGTVMLAGCMIDGSFVVAPYRHCGASIFTQDNTCVNHERELDDVWEEIVKAWETMN